MRIRADWYKPSGKWYSGGVVDIDDARLWRGDIPQAIMDNQEILVPKWNEHNEFTVVTSDLPEYDNDPDYRAFTFALFKPERFSELRRKEKQE